MILINVKTFNFNRYQFHISLDSSVFQLKKKLFKLTRIPIYNQRIIFQEKVLENTKPLSYYNIQNFDTVHLLRIDCITDETVVIEQQQQQEEEEEGKSEIFMVSNSIFQRIEGNKHRIIMLRNLLLSNSTDVEDIEEFDEIRNRVTNTFRICHSRADLLETFLINLDFKNDNNGNNEVITSRRRIGKHYTNNLDVDLHFTSDEIDEIPKKLRNIHKRFNVVSDNSRESIFEEDDRNLNIINRKRRIKKKKKRKKGKEEKEVQTKKTNNDNNFENILDDTLKSMFPFGNDNVDNAFGQIIDPLFDQARRSGVANQSLYSIGTFMNNELGISQNDDSEFDQIVNIFLTSISFNDYIQIMQGNYQSIENCYDQLRKFFIEELLQNDLSERSKRKKVEHFISLFENKIKSNEEFMRIIKERTKDRSTNLILGLKEIQRFYLEIFFELIINKYRGKVKEMISFDKINKDYEFSLVMYEIIVLYVGESYDYINENCCSGNDVDKFIEVISKELITDLPENLSSIFMIVGNQMISKLINNIYNNYKTKYPNRKIHRKVFSGIIDDGLRSKLE